MKVKRAEVRKIQESQRKLDNEEMSEEEEEEMTDEEGMTKIICLLFVIGNWWLTGKLVVQEIAPPC